jgi:predicted alpha-1,6-mannanase (GH76 family)
MASKQTYLAYAQAAAETLTTNWFPSNGPSTWVYQYSDFWRAPNALIALTRLSGLNGTWDYAATAADALSTFYNYFDPNISPEDRNSPAYYDDECWWGDAFLRVGQLDDNAQWNTAGQQIFLDLQGGWDDAAKGGVWWRRYPKSYPENNKDSIENELYMDIAMGLYRNDPQANYLEATKKTWNWMALLLDSSGLIWGNLKQDATINPDNVPRPYTQGCVLDALWDLYQHSKDPAYLDSAQSIADAAIETMCWPDGILQEICERRGNCGDDQDPLLFKGIYVRYLGELAVRLATLPDPARVAAAARYTEFLQRNADAVWVNFPGGTYGMDWHTLQPDYQPTGNAMTDGSLQTSALDLFISAALVSA